MNYIPNSSVELQQDSKTGETPRKREFNFPEGWDRTKPRDELLQELYSKGLIDTSRFVNIESPKVGGMVGFVGVESETPRRSRLPFYRKAE